jgi:chorismate mutase
VNELYEEEIMPHRETIDRLNNEIIEKIEERIGAALKIGEIKKRHRKPVVDETRERVILDRIRGKAEAKNIDQEGLERVFKEIIRLCVEAEERQ